MERKDGFSTYKYQKSGVIRLHRRRLVNVIGLFNPGCNKGIILSKGFKKYDKLQSGFISSSYGG